MADEQQTLDQQTPEQPTGAAEDLTTRVQELEEQLAAAQDQALRMVADLQNVRRRAEQDVEKAHKFALEKFAGDLLAVVDTLERGLEMSDPNDEAIKPMREGMELTLKMFDDTLRRYQVEALNPEGEPFNPRAAPGDGHAGKRFGRAGQCPQGVPERLPAQRPPAASGDGGSQQGAGGNPAVHRRAGLKFDATTPSG